MDDFLRVTLSLLWVAGIVAAVVLLFRRLGREERRQRASEAREDREAQQAGGDDHDGNRADAGI